jgi:hypothetical protein
MNWIADYELIKGLHRFFASQKQMQYLLRGKNFHCLQNKICVANNPCNPLHPYEIRDPFLFIINL